ncbi:PadR family transcriptional regulator [Catellatospora bangladeshensis]|uniref:Negative transcription regulator PadR n=1 Tax=Catellatospora bangladeshensis TaxID=310355 RepID=A0A8J3JUV4_9ACTN|nr:PadR family transcriptional regulator [Catellatospora bangladeshensis]GIF85488.1 negative transcription regulator PadR [Catellatospora bangladeshensis]
MGARDGDDSATAGSTLGYALLSLLTRGPATGYQLASRVKAPIGHFWTAKHSQIYPELARLAAAGWVRAAEEAGPGPRAKKTYELTPDGLAALRAWLVVPPVAQPRSEITLKAYAANSGDPAAMAALYGGLAAQAARTLAEYEQDAADMRAQGMDDPAHPRFGNYAVLLMGLESQRVVQRWSAWLAASLDGGAPVPYPHPPAPRDNGY